MKQTRIIKHLLTIFLILVFSIGSVIALEPLQISKEIQISGTIQFESNFFYGVCSHPWSLTERDFQEMNTLGVKYVRLDFSWAYFEPTRDATFRFSQYDQIVNWGTQYGIEVVALPLYIPSWLRVTGGDSTTIPASGPAFDDFVTQYGEFIYALVSHYQGSVKYFEIWNEPNTRASWDDPDGTSVPPFYIGGGAIPKYVALLKEAYMQAKAANPDCKVISGGIANDVNYLQGMYDSGVQGYFDYFGSHPYFNHSPTKNYDPDNLNLNDPSFGFFPKIEFMWDVMVANGDSDKKIFITELGIGDSVGPEGPTTDEMRADRLTRVFEKIDYDPGYPFIAGLMWYQLRESSSSPSYVYSILTEDYTPKPIFYAYQDVISQHSS